MKVEFKAYYKCLISGNCDIAIMDERLGLIVCSAADIICNYCEIKYEIIKINGEKIE